MTNLVQLTIPTPAPVLDGATKMLDSARAFAVANTDDYRTLTDIRQTISGRIKTLEEQHQKIKKPILEAGRNVDDLFKPAIKVLEDAKTIVTQKLGNWDTEQRRIAAEKQREADERARKEREAAEKAAREERERAAAAQREQERIAAEKRAAEDKAAREAAEAKAREEESKRKAAEAAARGDKEAKEAAERAAAEDRKKAVVARAAQLKAEQEREATAKENERLRAESEARARELDETAANTVAETVKAEVVEVAGLSRAKVWKWKLVDKRKLKDEFLLVDEKSINRLVTTMKDRAGTVVGDGAIEVYQEEAIRQRS